MSKEIVSLKNIEKDLLKWYSERLPLWKNDPVLFAEEVCNFFPLGKQKEILASLTKEDKIIISAGRAVGKSEIAGIIALWFVVVYYDSIVLITSPNFQQLSDVIFGSIRRHHRSSPLLKLLFTATAKTFRHKAKPETWQIVIKTASDGESIRGYNRVNKLYIMDETTGIHDEIIDALLGSTDEANSKVVMISNPTKRTGKFFRIFTDTTAYPEWERIKVSRLETGYEIIALTSIAKAKKALATWKRAMLSWGEEHPNVRIEIMGEFPLQDNNMAIPLILFDSVSKDDPFSGELKKEVVSANIGVDIAGVGGDSIVFTLNRLNYDYNSSIQRRNIKPIEHFSVLKSYARQNYTFSRDALIQSAISVVSEYTKLGGNFLQLYVHIDATGVGSAFVDYVKEALEGSKLLINGYELRKWVTIISTQFHEKANEIKHYTNRRSEMGEQFRHKLEKNAELVSQGDQPIIYIDTSNPTMYRGINREIGEIMKEYDSKGRVKYESKDAIRKRISSSTDVADSLFLSSYIKKPRSLWFI